MFVWPYNGQEICPHELVIILTMVAVSNIMV